MVKLSGNQENGAITLAMRHYGYFKTLKKTVKTVTRCVLSVRATDTDVIPLLVLATEELALWLESSTQNTLKGTNVSNFPWHFHAPACCLTFHLLLKFSASFVWHPELTYRLEYTHLCMNYAWHKHSLWVFVSLGRFTHFHSSWQISVCWDSHFLVKYVLMSTKHRCGWLIKKTNIMNAAVL